VYSKIVILKFPVTDSSKPIICDLVRKYDLCFNILNAQIFPRKEGKMVLELTGDKDNLKKGINFLKKEGISVESAGNDIKRNIDKCTHCGSCTAVCPTEALSIKRPEMIVEFDHEKCTHCELCINTCPTRAMYVRPSIDGLFFSDNF